MGLVVALSETTTALLAALLGALVGGIATLGGSMLINRWDRAMDARLRMYDQLIPRANALLAELYAFQSIEDPPTSEVLEQRRRERELAECWEAIRRACVLASRPERQWRKSTLTAAKSTEQDIAKHLVLLEPLLERRIH